MSRSWEQFVVLASEYDERSVVDGGYRALSAGMNELALRAAIQALYFDGPSSGGAALFQQALPKWAAESRRNRKERPEVAAYVASMVRHSHSDDPATEPFCRSLG